MVYAFLSMQFFMICTVVGFGILAPLNFTDTYLADHPGEKEENSYGTLDKLTILNISYGSMRYTCLLKSNTIILYISTFLVMCLLDTMTYRSPCFGILFFFQFFIF